MGLLSKIFGKKVDYKELIDNGAKIIDVRTPGEFQQGHCEGSINVPLQKIEQKAKQIKKMGVPIIVCCASGMRSAQAKGILKRKGITEVYNAGSCFSSKIN